MTPDNEIHVTAERMLHAKYGEILFANALLVAQLDAARRDLELARQANAVLTARLTRYVDVGEAQHADGA